MNKGFTKNEKVGSRLNELACALLSHSLMCVLKKKMSVQKRNKGGQEKRRWTEQEFMQMKKCRADRSFWSFIFIHSFLVLYLLLIKKSLLIFFLIDKKYKPILEHKLSHAGEPNKDIWHANLIHPSNSEMRSQMLAQWSFWSYLLTKTWCPEKMAIQRYSWSKCLLDNCIDCDAEITLID